MKKVKNWLDIDEPWFENEDFHDILLSKINILDVLDYFEIPYTKCSQGDFTHKMTCPLPVHQGGNERTASFFISEKQNSFYCFGCNSKNNLIDFIILYKGMPYHAAMKWLATTFGLTKNDISDIHIEKKPKRDPEKTINRQAYYCGREIKDILDRSRGKKDYDQIKNWADRQFLKLDQLMELEDDNWEVIKKFREKIKKKVL